MKVGKTDLALGLVAALVTGGDFLGQPAERMPVVFLTEQGGPSLRASLARAGLADAPVSVRRAWARPGDDRQAAQLLGTAFMFAPIATAAACVMLWVVRKYAFDLPGLSCMRYMPGVP